MANTGKVTVPFNGTDYTVEMTLERIFSIEESIEGGISSAFTTRNGRSTVGTSMREGVAMLRAAIGNQVDDLDDQLAAVMAAGGATGITEGVTPLVLYLIAGASNPETDDDEVPEAGKA